jgi:hypothetical protein
LERAFLTEGSAIVEGNSKPCLFKAGDGAGHHVDRRDQTLHIKRIGDGWWKLRFM